MPESPAINWQDLYRQRQDIADRFGDIWDLPLDKRYHLVLSRHGAEGSRLIEVGAGDRGLESKMRGYWGDLEYSSCDIDETYPHEFGHYDDISGEFDVACAFELIEHMPLGDAYAMLCKLHEVITPGGKLLLTTPNIYYPPAFLRDATHITPFCYDELGAVVQLAGFRVTHLYRLHHDSVIKKFLKRFVFYPLYRIVGIDFSKQIMLVAEKPG